MPQKVFRHRQMVIGDNPSLDRQSQDSTWRNVHFDKSRQQKLLLVNMRYHILAIASDVWVSFESHIYHIINRLNCLGNSGIEANLRKFNVLKHLPDSFLHWTVSSSSQMRRAILHGQIITNVNEEIKTIQLYLCCTIWCNREKPWIVPSPLYSMNHSAHWPKWTSRIETYI